MHELRDIFPNCRGDVIVLSKNNDKVVWLLDVSDEFALVVKELVQYKRIMFRTNDQSVRYMDIESEYPDMKCLRPDEVNSYNGSKYAYRNIAMYPVNTDLKDIINITRRYRLVQ